MLNADTEDRVGISGVLRHGRYRGAQESPNNLTVGFIKMSGVHDGDSTTSFTDPTIPAGNWVWFEVDWQDAVESVNEIALSIEYTRD